MILRIPETQLKCIRDSNKYILFIMLTIIKPINLFSVSTVFTTVFIQCISRMFMHVFDFISISIKKYIFFCSYDTKCVSADLKSVCR